jgi:hypothetical protein
MYVLNIIQIYYKKFDYSPLSNNFFSYFLAIGIANPAPLTA